MAASFMEINLLPSERVRDKYAFGIKTVSYGLLSVSIVIFGFLGWARSAHAKSDIVTLKSMAARQADVQKQLKTFHAEKMSQRNVDSYLQGVAGLREKPFVHELTSLEPKGGTLIEVSVADNAVTLNGQMQNLNDIAAYEDALTKSNDVKQVSLRSVTDSSPGSGLNFTLAISLGEANSK